MNAGDCYYYSNKSILNGSSSSSFAASTQVKLNDNVQLTHQENILCNCNALKQPHNHFSYVDNVRDICLKNSITYEQFRKMNPHIAELNNITIGQPYILSRAHNEVVTNGDESSFINPEHVDIPQKEAMVPNASSSSKIGYQNPVNLSEIYNVNDDDNFQINNQLAPIPFEANIAKNLVAHSNKNASNSIPQKNIDCSYQNDNNNYTSNLQEIPCPSSTNEINSGLSRKKN